MEDMIAYKRDEKGRIIASQIIGALEKRNDEYWIINMDDDDNEIKTSIDELLTEFKARLICITVEAFPKIKIDMRLAEDQGIKVTVKRDD